MDRDERRQVEKVRKEIQYAAGIQTAAGVGILAFTAVKGIYSLPVAVACFLLLCSAVWTYWRLPVLVQKTLRNEEENGRYNALRLLSQYRHDVMNHVQLLKGYLQLQKIEKLHGPIQKLVADAKRHSLLSNLPGISLPYLLLQRDLAAPLLQLTVEVVDASDKWDPGYEQKLLETLPKLADAGEQLSQELGIQVEWSLKICRSEDSLSITLHVLGEHVNDTYIEDLVFEFGRFGLRLKERVQTGQEYILLFGS